MSASESHTSATLVVFWLERGPLAVSLSCIYAYLFLRFAEYWSSTVLPIALSATFNRPCRPVCLDFWWPV